MTGGSIHADWIKYLATDRAAMPQMNVTSIANAYGVPVYMLSSLDLNWSNLTEGGTVVGVVGRPAAAGTPPPSFAAALDGIARWLEVTDAILVRRGERKATEIGTVPADLRRVAAALREDPTLDDLMMDALIHGPEGAV